jgi:hypothetical protein
VKVELTKAELLGGRNSALLMKLCPFSPESSKMVKTSRAYESELIKGRLGCKMNPIPAEPVLIYFHHIFPIQSNISSQIL